MKRILLAAIAILLLGIPATGHAERLKDIATISGVRENQLVGYGLVVGLNGTGDKTGSMTQALVNMLDGMGISVRPSDLKPKNVAAVTVTADLPTFISEGSRIDVIVSSISDAKSLQGGTLLMTPLMGPDGNVYAVAQGPVSIGGFSAGGGGTAVSKGHPTVARVPEGAIVEKKVPISYQEMASVDVVLSVQDFSTAHSLLHQVNKALQGDYATADGPRTISVKVPERYQGKVIELLAILEGIEVATDTPARVVINEKTGTVVLGDRVTVAPVAISHGSLTVSVKTDFGVSQPRPFSEGATVVVPKTELEVTEEKAALVPIGGTNLGEVVRALNALGVTPRDLIAILQALKASGSLRADLEIL